MMNKTARFTLVLITLPLLFGWIMAGDIKHIQGKQIILLDELQVSLSAKIKKAGDQFIREGKEEYFLTGYCFSASSRARISGNYIDTHSESVSRIYREGDRLVIRHFGRCPEQDESTGIGSVDRDVILLCKRVGRRIDIVDTSLLNPDFIYRLADATLYWLGRIDTGESLNFLINIFKSKTDLRLRKHILPVVGLHAHAGAMDFLYTVVKDRDNPVKLRKSAVFWMGASRLERGLVYLKKIDSRETEYEIRKQLAFAYYLNGSAEADRHLIGLARNDRVDSVRKKAVFWLGQRATKASIRALKEILENEDEIEVKSSAVFAVSQLPRDKAVPMLIDIARTHRSSKIRKKAIFWLGDIGDERAIDFFEDILLK
jgi:HEAT repeat protein